MSLHIVAMLAAACLSAMIPVAAAAQAPAPADSAAMRPAAAPAATGGFSALARRLSPAVVGISVSRSIPGMPRDSAHAGVGAVASGSGFVLGADGLVVTNNHVIEGGSTFEVSLQDGVRLPARLLGRDPETDLAVLRVTSPRPLAFVSWGDSDKAEVGDWAIAIGSPFGLGGSVSVGVISGRNRDLQAGRFDDFLQTDAAINRGNSGGPLFNAAGEVVGVNTAIVSPGGSQGGSVGVGFAVPSNLARRIVADLARTGSVARGWIGVRARVRSIAEGSLGVVVTEVAPGSPAARGGLKPGDVILGFAGRQVTDPRFLARAVSEARAGQPVRITGLRGRQQIFANVTVSAPPGAARAAAPEDTAPTAIATSLGLTLRARVARDALPASVRVVVQAVDPLGPSRSLVQAGDGLLEVQGRPVGTAQEARAALEEAARARDAVVVKLARGQQSLYRAVRPARR